MRRLLSGLSVIAFMGITIGIGAMDPAAAGNTAQEQSTRNADTSGKTAIAPARNKRSTAVVNHPPPRNGAYYKGIFRN
ncbi:MULTISPECIES: hypothetical protein [unclassified Ensifer]|uniref:hypothetical protein n=1 Tax=unclassified Ensifer TaxID=2633371 RepID=UPI000B043179|nr:MULTISPECIES: hypothetical protein [unclassified Ensifer]